MYSSPPRHGAEIAVAILKDPELYKQWRVCSLALLLQIFLFDCITFVKNVSAFCYYWEAMKGALKDDRDFSAGMSESN